MNNDYIQTSVPCTATIASCKPAMPSDYINHLIDSPMIQKQEGINPMRNFNAPPVATSVLAVSGSIPMESIQRDFLTQRVGQICDKHDKVLRKQFFMDAQDRPLSARDLIKAITDGNFTLDEALLAKHDEEELRSYYNNEYGIRW